MLTAAEIQSLLVMILAGATDGDEERWREMLGEPTLFPLATHPTPNWTFHPDSTPDERGVIAEAIRIVRGEHPHARR